MVNRMVYLILQFMITHTNKKIKTHQNRSLRIKHKLTLLIVCYTMAFNKRVFFLSRLFVMFLSLPFLSFFLLGVIYECECVRTGHSAHTTHTRRARSQFQVVLVQSVYIMYQISAFNRGCCHFGWLVSSIIKTQVCVTIKKNKLSTGLSFVTS